LRVCHRTCGTCSGPSSQTTSLTYGTSSTPPCEKPLPGSEASHAPLTSWTLPSSPSQSRWAG
jgi:hypothetical protein